MNQTTPGKNHLDSRFWVPILVTSLFAVGSFIWAISQQAIARRILECEQDIKEMNAMGTSGLREIKPLFEQLVRDVKELKDKQEAVRIDVEVIKREVLK